MVIPTKKTYRLLPYGQSDFATIRRSNKYYVDKTMFIPALEEFNYQMFLRPRRFGKSLMLNMLGAYYDVSMKDDFDMLFGDLYIVIRTQHIEHQTFAKPPRAKKHLIFVLFECGYEHCLIHIISVFSANRRKVALSVW